jgi:beta-glucosidase
VPALRAARPDLPVGVTLNMSPAVPASDSASDLAAAARQDLLVNRLFTDPLLAGVYPAEAEQGWGDLTDFGFVREGDLATIAVPLDFLGINYYYRIHVRDSSVPVDARSAYQIGIETVTPDGAQRTGLGWPIEPEGLHATLTGLRSRYPDLPPIYITENGCAYADEVGVEDRERIAFIEGHLAATAKAIAEGVDVRGYFHWSLLDNFEWARGYAPRFGLVHVDYATQARTPKASFGWLRERIAAAR